jgi:hypothetical protein
MAGYGLEYLDAAFTLKTSKRFVHISANAMGLKSIGKSATIESFI